MTMEKFITVFNDKYNEIYDFESNAGGDYPGARMATSFYDLWSKEPDNKTLLSEVIKARGDYITSDREAAAFILALDEIGFF